MSEGHFGLGPCDVHECPYCQKERLESILDDVEILVFAAGTDRNYDGSLGEDIREILEGDPSIELAAYIQTFKENRDE